MFKKVEQLLRFIGRHLQAIIAYIIAIMTFYIEHHPNNFVVNIMLKIGLGTSKDTFFVIQTLGLLFAIIIDAFYLWLLKIFNVVNRFSIKVNYQDPEKNDVCQRITLSKLGKQNVLGVQRTVKIIFSIHCGSKLELKFMKFLNPCIQLHFNGRQIVDFSNAEGWSNGNSDVSFDEQHGDIKIKNICENISFSIRDIEKEYSFSISAKSAETGTISLVPVVLIKKMKYLKYLLKIPQIEEKTNLLIIVE